MIWLALMALVFGYFVWLGRSLEHLTRRNWRTPLGITAIACLGGAAFLGARGLWWEAIALAVVGGALALTVRRRVQQRPAIQTPLMSRREAAAILGVGLNPTAEEVNAAYGRLIRVNHPDRGGTDGLAAQLNAARDLLLRR